MASIGSISDLIRGLREQKARTVTTLLGIAWGTFSVVVLLAFGLGLEARMQKESAGIGRGISVVWPQETTMPFEGLGRGRRLRLRRTDATSLLRQVPEVELVSPEYVARDRVQVGQRILGLVLSGVTPEYAELRAWDLEPGGRFLNDRDLSERRRVVVLGDRVRDALFGSGEAVGRTVVLRGLPFTVIGVLRPKLQDSSYYSNDTDRACLPATTHEQVFNRRHLDNFVFRARDEKDHARATDGIYEALGRALRFDPRDRQALYILDTLEEERIRSYAFLGFHLMLAGSGVLTLLVGGVGVGNLMFIRVRQRTREIGIQMALGAKPRRILRGVLAESLVLVAAGGALGFVLACLAAATTRMTPAVEQIGEPRILPLIAVSTVFLLGATGLLAGYFPARRAARLDPVRALAD